MDILWVERSPKMGFLSHPRTKLSALETALRRISQVGAKEFPEVARPMEETRQAARERQGKRTDLTSGPREPEVTRSAAAIARQLGISGSTVKRVDRLEREAPVMLTAVASGQAKDTELVSWVTELKVRAERRVGELITAQKTTVGLARPAVGSKVKGDKRAPVKDTRPTLADAGIDKKLAATGFD